AVDEGLEVAIEQLSWRKNARTRICFLLLDAPPHSEPEVKARLRRLTAQAAEKGIRIVPVAASGINKSTEYFLRCVALFTNGTYVFLTDDSGIGDSHIKPTAEPYQVETLNALLLRILYQYTDHPGCTSPPSALEQPDTLSVFHWDLLAPPQDSSGLLHSHAHTSTHPPVKNPDELLRWSYYPNPTRGVVHIEVEGGKGALLLTDISGKVLRRYALEGPRFDMDLGAFPAGTYFIRYEYKPDHFLSGKVLRIR
ncbi:MAG: T9SS type A sorting domain-containing protein, partial [Bacteroidota bacterium]